MAFTLQYVPVLDGGCPRTVTGYAKEYISGGAFVMCSGAAGVVNVSGLSSLATTDIQFAIASGAQFNGIATHAAASGAPITVASAGMFIVGCEVAVTAGYPVLANGANGVAPYTLALGSVGNHPIGRSWTSAGSEGYCAVTIGQV